MENITPPPKKKRGRKPKNKLVENSSETGNTKNIVVVPKPD